MMNREKQMYKFCMSKVKNSKKRSWLIGEMREGARKRIKGDEEGDTNVKILYVLSKIF